MWRQFLAEAFVKVVMKAVRFVECVEDGDGKERTSMVILQLLSKVAARLKLMVPR